jgi:hypothetical protein
MAQPSSLGCRRAFANLPPEKGNSDLRIPGTQYVRRTRWGNLDGLVVVVSQLLRSESSGGWRRL